jgi:hypothetical protein
MLRPVGTRKGVILFICYSLLRYIGINHTGALGWLMREVPLRPPPVTLQ